MKPVAGPSHKPRVYATIAGAIAVVLLLAGVLPLPLPDRAVPSSTPAALRTIPNTDVNPYGANFFLDWEVEPWKIDKTLQMAKEAGLGWANLHFAWEGLEPKRGSFWDDRQNKSTWEKYDYLVRTAQKYGLQVIARLDRPPNWTRQDNSFHERPPDDLADYGNFVAAVAAHYEGLIRHYQIWNEPNIFPEWGDRPVDAAGYVQLLKTAYERIKEANPAAMVLSAPLAQTTERGASNLSELDYLDAMYRAGAKDYFDILYANGYGFDAPPEEPADPGKLNFSRVVLVRQIMERYGDGNKAIWLHEFGWNAAPASMAPEKLLWRRVTEEQQAEYTVRAIQKARQEWPWAGVFSIWYFRQDGHISPDRADYYFRMVDPGFTPRKVYGAVAEATKGLAWAGAGSYQESNPALIVDSSWHDEPNGGASGSAWLVSDKPGASLTIRFAGTEFNLVVGRQPDGPRLLVTVDGRPSNLLPGSGDGRSYIDLKSSAAQIEVVSVASGLVYGQHTVRVVVAPDSARKAIIDGFQVGATAQSGGGYYAGAAAFVAILFVLFILHKRRGRTTGRAA